MNITEVKIRGVFPEAAAKAVVSIVIDGGFAVNNIRIMKSRKGRLFIAMPEYRTEGGRYHDAAHPVNSGARRVLREKVFAAYYKYLENAYLPGKGVINVNPPA